MSLDILIFAVIAALLIHRLRSVLGEKHGDERQRPNPFSDNKDSYKPNAPDTTPNVIPISPEFAASLPSHNFEKNRSQILENETINEGAREGLLDIVENKPNFDVNEFIQGSNIAFKMIVKGYASGDREILKKLLSPKLFADFDAGITNREKTNQTMEYDLERIKKTEIIKANLAGQMIYITVDFDVEHTTIIRDENGNVVEGDPDLITNVHDIWVFAKDNRTNDPNWMLIETSTS